MKVHSVYFKSAVTVDNVIFAFDDGELKVLLIKRLEEPFRGDWALPGDFVLPNEDLDDAPQRVLMQLTGMDNVYLEQVGIFGKVERHPAGRVYTVAYYSLINVNTLPKVGQIHEESIEWRGIRQLSGLPFDHAEILLSCIIRLQQRVRVRPIGFELLPDKFTLSELQGLYEAILNKVLDKRNFRKKILGMGILVDVDELQEGVAHRPAKLYSFDKERYETFMSKGFVFEI